MSEKLEHRVNRDGWPAGPWDQEPEDRIEWRHAGLPCLMVRNTLGNWCGYAAVAPSHPAFEKEYDSVDVDVHGGLTYSNHCRGPICHVPNEGESEKVWWLGFDCAHLYDLSPGMIHGSYRSHDDIYRDKHYVEEQVNHLAEQLVRLAFVIC